MYVFVRCDLSVDFFQFQQKPTVILPEYYYYYDRCCSIREQPCQNPPNAQRVENNSSLKIKGGGNVVEVSLVAPTFVD